MTENSDIDVDMVDKATAIQKKVQQLGFRVQAKQSLKDSDAVMHKKYNNHKYSAGGV